jgi:hypothetical protein
MKCAPCDRVGTFLSKTPAISAFQKQPQRRLSRQHQNLRLVVGAVSTGGNGLETFGIELQNVVLFERGMVCADNLLHEF